MLQRKIDIRQSWQHCNQRVSSHFCSQTRSCQILSCNGPKCTHTHTHTHTHTYNWRHFSIQCSPTLPDIRKHSFWMVPRLRQVLLLIFVISKWRCMEHWWRDNDRGNWSTGRDMSQCHCVHRKIARTGIETKAPRWQATDCLSLDSLYETIIIIIIRRRRRRWWWRTERGVTGNTLFNPLKTKRRLLYLKTQFLPRSKHFSSLL